MYFYRMVMIFVSFILRKWKKVCGNLIETFERLKLKCFRSTLEALSEAGEKKARKKGKEKRRIDGVIDYRRLSIASGTNYQWWTPLSKDKR